MSALAMSFAVRAANALASSVWEGLLLALAVWLVLRLLPGVSAAVRSGLWMAVFVVLVLLHLRPVAGTAHAAAAASALHLDPRWSVALAAVWLGLSAWRGVQLAMSALRLRRIAARATPVEQAARSIGSRSYRVCVSEDVDRPSVAGFFHPRVLVPPALFAALTPAELRTVLLHETEHLRRGDDWTNLFQKAALVLFPLNPVLVWVERRLCLERELACDDRVLAETGAPKAYASCLTSLAERSLLRRGVSLALGVLGRESELSRRVHRILAGPQQRLGARATAGVVGAVLLALGTGGYQLSRTPEWISFSPVASVESAVAFVPVRAGGAHFPGARFQETTFREPKPAASRPKMLAARAVLRPRRAAKRQLSLAPRVMKAEWRERSSEAGYGQNELAARQLMLTSASVDQVSYMFIPAVMRVPAYAAVPVPNGWIIFQL
jgi:Zn-dependent protease with chaperone function